MFFGAAAEEFQLSSCRKILTKVVDNPQHGSSSSSTGVMEGRSPFLIQSTHAFSARIDQADGGNYTSTSSSSSSSSAPLWDVTLRLLSDGPETPNMLIGFGPRWGAALPSQPSQEVDVEGGHETQPMFERRVLSTPLLWEEPGFVMLECRGDGGPRFWSDTLGLYGAAPSSLLARSTVPPQAGGSSSCFKYSKSLSRWVADIRWTLQRCSTKTMDEEDHASALCFDAYTMRDVTLEGSQDTSSTWTHVASCTIPPALVCPEPPRDSAGRLSNKDGDHRCAERDPVDLSMWWSPYVTVLHNVQSEAHIL